MNKIIIPNTITSLNILCGTSAILVALTNSEHLYIASFFIIISIIFDFFDGFTARLLKAQSEFGKQMDSLADLVSFGLAPTFIMFNLLKKSTTCEYLPYLSFMIVVFSAIRLAIFNISEQKFSFNGLPTPAFAILVASFPLMQKQADFSYFIPTPTISSFFLNQYFLLSITVVFSILLVSNIKMLALKFKNFKLKDNKIKYIFIIITLILLIAFRFFAIPMIIIIYIIMSLLLKKTV